MRMILPRIVLPLVMLGVASSQALADGVVRDAVGAISTARGGTNLGFNDNAAIILDNPAGMVSACDCGFWELGVDTVICDLHYSDPDNDVFNEVKGFPSGMFGIVRRSPDSAWAYGLGVFAPAGFTRRIRYGQPTYRADALQIARRARQGATGSCVPGERSAFDRR